MLFQEIWYMRKQWLILRSDVHFVHALVLYLFVWLWVLYYHDIGPCKISVYTILVHLSPSKCWKPFFDLMNVKI